MTLVIMPKNPEILEFSLQRALEMRSLGFSNAQIGKHFGVSRQFVAVRFCRGVAVANVSKKHGRARGDAITVGDDLLLRRLEEVHG